MNQTVPCTLCARDADKGEAWLFEGGSGRAETSAALFAVLGNAKRLSVMRHLLQGEWSVNELAKRVELSQSALSQHLARLREAGLVETRRERQSIFYSSQSEVARRVIAALDGHDGLPGTGGVDAKLA